MTRRMTRAEVARALRDLEKIWRPADPQNKTATSGQAGSGGIQENGHAHFTPSRAVRKGTP